MALHMRPVTEEEAQTIKKWSQSRTEEARLVERAKIIRLASMRIGLCLDIVSECGQDRQ